MGCLQRTGPSVRGPTAPGRAAPASSPLPHRRRSFPGSGPSESSGPTGAPGWPGGRPTRCDGRFPGWKPAVCASGCNRGSCGRDRPVEPGCRPIDPRCSRFAAWRRPLDRLRSAHGMSPGELRDRVLRRNPRISGQFEALPGQAERSIGAVKLQGVFRPFSPAHSQCADEAVQPSNSKRAS